MKVINISSVYEEPQQSKVKNNNQFLNVWMGLPHTCPMVKIIKQEECKQQENSILSQMRSDIAHRVTLSKSLDF